MGTSPRHYEGYTLSGLVMRPRLNRIINIVLAALYAITIAGGAVGEWGYYILGSVIDALLLAVVVHTALDLA